MFITIKSKISKKFYRVLLCFAVVFLCAVVVVTACVIQKTPKKNIECEKGEYSAVLSADNGAELFASQFSYEIDEMIYEKQVRIPSQFSDTYEEYNEVQLLQGLDLNEYKGEDCTLCVYKLKNYTIDYEKAFLTILSKNNTVIGGHLSTYQYDSEIYTFFGE